MTTAELTKSVTTTTHTVTLDGVPENVLVVSGGDFTLTGAVVTIKTDDAGTKVTMGVTGQMTYPSGQVAKVNKAGLFNPAGTAPTWLLKAVNAVVDLPEDDD